MRIDKLTVDNFKGFDHRDFLFHPQFNLIVGTNGTGKTSALDALAVAAGCWFLGLRGYDTRHIGSNEIRLAANDFDGEIRFETQYPARVEASGVVMGQLLSWERSVQFRNGKTRFLKAKNVKKLAIDADNRVRAGQSLTLPLISYYGTGRLWKEPRAESQVTDPEKLVGKNELSRFEGYKNSVSPHLSMRDLVVWIARQSWIGYQQGKESQVFQAVKKAIVECVEDADNLYFDPKRGEVIVVMKDHGAQPFFNLSDGQRCMLAMVGDIAQKAAKLNPHLGDQALLETPGVVLIDELDLHLHPRWQRRVITDLRRTFPKIQFVCTTHSPQLIGQAKSDELLLLDRQQFGRPAQSLGMDSNWVLRNIMGSYDRDPEIAAKFDSIFANIEESEFENARHMIVELRGEIGEHPDLVEAEAIISRYSRFNGSSEG